MKNKRILLTGSSGYIGSVLKRQLVEKGYEVVEFDIRRSVEEDIRDINNLNKTKKIGLVINLAGIVGEPNCQLDINKTYRTNVEGTNNVITYCKENKIPFIMASTCSVYGKKEGMVSEEELPNPIGIYAITKMMNEYQITESLDNYIICRLGTLYGLSPSQRYDLVIPGMTRMAFEEKKVVVFGGKQKRPFISTEELSKTLCKLVEEFDKGKQKEVYNLVAFNESILNIGKKVSKTTKARLVVKKLEIDERNYIVSNEKVSKIYLPKNTLVKEIRRLWRKLEND